MSLQETLKKLGMSANDIAATMHLTEATDQSADDPLESPYVTPELLARIVNLDMKKLGESEIGELISEFRKKKLPVDGTLAEDSRVVATLLADALAESKKRAPKSDDDEGDEGDEDDEEDYDDEEDDDEEEAEEGDGGVDEAAFQIATAIADAVDESTAQALVFAIRNGFDPLSILAGDTVDAAMAAYESAVQSSLYGLLKEESDLMERRVARAMRAGKMVRQRLTSAKKKLAGRMYRRVNRAQIKLLTKKLLRRKAAGQITAGEKKTAVRRGKSLADIRSKARNKLSGAMGRSEQIVTPEGSKAESLAESILASIPAPAADAQRERIVEHLLDSLASCVVLFEHEGGVEEALVRLASSVKLNPAHSEEEFVESLRPLAVALEKLMERVENNGDLLAICEGISAKTPNIGESLNIGSLSFEALRPKLIPGVTGQPMPKAVAHMQTVLEAAGVDISTVKPSWYLAAHTALTEGN